MDGQPQNSTLRATASLLLGMMGMALCIGTMAVFPNQIIEAFSLVSAQQGLMNSLTMTGSLAAVVVVPFLQGRVAKTVMLAAGGLVQAVSMAVTGMAPGLPLLLVGCALTGVAHGWIDTYANARMVDIHQKNSARYMGLLHGCFGLGSILTPLILQGLLYLTDWRGAYLIVGAIALAIAIVTIWGNRGPAGGGAPQPEQRLNRGQLGAFFSDKVGVFATLAMLFYGASQIALTGWLVRYMAVRYNAEALGSLGVSLFWVCVTASRFLAPRLPVPPLKLVAVGMAATAILHTVGVLANNPAVMVAMVAASGLTSGFAVPMLIHAVVSRHPTRTALATTLTMLAMRVAQIAVPLLLGLVAVFSMQFSMMITAILALLTALAGGAAVLAQRREKAAE